MNTNLLHTSAFASAFLVAAIVFAWSSPAFSTVGTEPQTVFLSGGVDRPEIGGLNGFERASQPGVLMMAKGRRAGADDNPKPHGPLHRRIENSLPSDQLSSTTGELIPFTEGKKGRIDDDPKPEGRDDRKVEAPFSGNQSASSDREGILLSKGKKARKAPGTLDAPTRNAPHAPGQAHG